MKALSKECSDTWALSQLFELAFIFSKEGNKKAKEAIYSRYGKKIIEGSAWCGEAQILELDSLEGLKYIAEVRGKALTENSEDWEDSFLVDSFQKDNPTIRVYEELEKAAENNLDTKTYL